MTHPFHFAFHVTDLDVARHFYGSILGCTEGRSTDTWVDFNFFGHQLSLHLGKPFEALRTGKVDGIAVPMPHFGAVLPMKQWQALAVRLQAASIEFIIPPSIRYAGQPGEQGTLFFCDPCGNPIEMKGFAHMEGVFAS